MMAKNYVTKIDLLSRLYKWKTGLSENTFQTNLTIQQKFGYDQALNDILEFSKEFRD